LLKNSNKALPLKLPVGGGSGTGRFSHIVSPLDAVKAQAARYGGLVQYVTNNTIVPNNSGLSSIAPSPPDVCLVFLKSWAPEGADYTSMVAGWNSTAVVENMVSNCPITVVIFHGATPNVVPFALNSNVTAIIAAIILR